MSKNLLSTNGRTLFLPRKMKISLPEVRFQSTTFFNEVNFDKDGYIISCHEVHNSPHRSQKQVRKANV